MENQFFTLRDQRSGKCVAVANDLATNGTNVELANCDFTANVQRWHFNPDPNLWKLEIGQIRTAPMSDGTVKCLNNWGSITVSDCINVNPLMVKFKVTSAVGKDNNMQEITHIFFGPEGLLLVVMLVNTKLLVPGHKFGR